MILTLMLSWTIELVRLLKANFSHIFVLAIQKEDPTAKFDHWDHDVWYWEVNIRRCIFGCEVKIWEVFLNVLNNTFLYENTTDKIIWTVWNFF